MGDVGDVGDVGGRNKMIPGILVGRRIWRTTQLKLLGAVLRLSYRISRVYLGLRDFSLSNCNAPVPPGPRGRF